MPNSAITLDAGFNRLERVMFGIVPKTRRTVIALTQESGESWVQTTRANAVVDTGAYQKSIHFETVKAGFGALFIADVPYWAYLEFGTGGSVSIPDGWEELAAAYKGKGIRRVNLPARPNLIPAYLIECRRYSTAIQGALRDILR